MTKTVFVNHLCGLLLMFFYIGISLKVGEEILFEFKDILLHEFYRRRCRRRMDSDIEINEDLKELRIDEGEIAVREPALKLNHGKSKTDLCLHLKSTKESMTVHTVHGEKSSQKGHPDLTVSLSRSGCDKLLTIDMLGFADDKSTVSRDTFGSADKKSVYSGNKDVNLVAADKLGSTDIGFADDNIDSENQTPASTDLDHAFADTDTFGSVGSADGNVCSSNRHLVLVDDKLNITDKLKFTDYNSNFRNKMSSSGSCKNTEEVIQHCPDPKRKSWSTKEDSTSIDYKSVFKRNIVDTNANSVNASDTTGCNIKDLCIKTHNSGVNINGASFDVRKRLDAKSEEDSSVNMNGSSLVPRDSANKQTCSCLDEVEHNLQTIQCARDKLILKGKEMENDLNAFIDSFIDATEKHRNMLLSQIREIVLKRDEEFKNLANELELMKKGVNDKTLSTESKHLLNSSDTGTCGETSTYETLKFVREIPSAVIAGFQMFGVITDSSRVHDNCFLTSDSESAPINKELQILLHQTDGITPVNIQAWVKRKNSKGDSNFLGVRFKKTSEKQCSLYYTPRHIGLHQLYVQVDGIPVKGSPMTINVVKPNKRRKTDQNHLDINVHRGYFVNDSRPYYNGERWSVHDCIIPESSVNNTNKRKLREVTV